MFELPKRKTLVHKPVEFRNLCAEAKKRIASVCNEDWLWEIKYDGVHGILVVTPESSHLYSREGNECISCPHIIEASRKLKPAVYFGEVWSMFMEFPEISGAFRRQYASEESAKLRYKVFDMVSLDEFQIGVSNDSFELRRENLWASTGAARGDDINFPIQQVAGFTYSDEALGQTNSHIEDMRRSSVFGTDGFIAKRKGGDWTAGNGAKGQTIKVKDHISVDLRCVGFVEGLGKFAGMVGALLVTFKGQTVPVGGGKLTDKERLAYFTDPAYHIVGKIVEVHALGLTPDGQLREPRFQRIRDDKLEPSE
jgi:DNA ligase-1